jgi:hypothetical protein
MAIHMTHAHTPLWCHKLIVYFSLHSNYIIPREYGLGCEQCTLEMKSWVQMSFFSCFQCQHCGQQFLFHNRTIYITQRVTWKQTVQHTALRVSSSAVSTLFSSSSTTLSPYTMAAPPSPQEVHRKLSVLSAARNKVLKFCLHNLVPGSMTMLLLFLP